jgi:hypothetical protein
MDIDGVEWLTRSRAVGMWTGRVRLPCFASCRPRYHLICTFPGPVAVGREFPDGQLPPPAPGPAGWVPLEVETPGGEPTPAQISALHRLIAGEPAAFRSVMERASGVLFDHYLAGRDLEFAEYRGNAARGPTPWEFPGGPAAFRAWMRTPAGISQTLHPVLVGVTPYARGDVAVTVVRFRCLFEPEHGLQAALVGADCTDAGPEVDLGE